MKHGTRWAYQRGCRCEWCVDEENAYQRDRYAARAMTGEVGELPLAGVPTPGPWRAQGRCRSAPLSLFFPERGDDTRQAKAICAGCPVVEQCRSYGLAYPELRGIWGGLSERGRARARRRLVAS